MRPIMGSDVAEGKDFEIRQTDPHLFLAATGDYDGDGSSDTVRFYVSEGGGTFVAKVHWGDKNKPAVIIHEDPIEKVARAALITVDAGDIKHICYDKFDTCDENERRIFELPYEAIAMTYFGGTQVVYSWNGNAFDAYWLAD